jgi:hypothetical protein
VQADVGGPLLRVALRWSFLKTQGVDVLEVRGDGDTACWHTAWYWSYCGRLMFGHVHGTPLKPTG